MLYMWLSYGKHCLWVPPFISALITIPTGKAAQRSLSNANALSLLAHNIHQLAVSHSPFTVYLPVHHAPSAHTTCSSDCLPGRPDSGQLFFSSTHPLINSKSHAKQPGESKSDKLRFKPLFSSNSLVRTRSPLYTPLVSLVLTLIFH